MKEEKIVFENEDECENHGITVRIPCKVGDTVYRVHYRDGWNKDGVEQLRVKKVLVIWDETYDEPMFRIDCVTLHTEKESSYTKEHIGRFVFITKKDAENALQEMKKKEEARQKLKEITPEEYSVLSKKHAPNPIFRRWNEAKEYERTYGGNLEAFNTENGKVYYVVYKTHFEYPRYWAY